MCTLWTHPCVHSDYFDGSLSHSKLFKCFFIAFRIFLTFGRYMALCPFSLSLFATTINSYLRRLLTTLIADVLLDFGKFSISAISFTDKSTSKTHFCMTALYHAHSQCNQVRPTLLHSNSGKLKVTLPIGIRYVCSSGHPQRKLAACFPRSFA